MRLMLSSWLVGRSSLQFEIMNPIVECVRRIRDLGSNVQIEVPFLQGAHNLSGKVVAELRNLGAEVHDVSKLTKQFRDRLPKFQEVYKNWGTINDLAILRHLVHQELLAGEPFIFMDNDIMLNVRPEQLIEAYQNQTFILDKSTCFGLIQDKNWLPTFISYIYLLHDNPAEYARAINFERDISELFAPDRVEGSDQAISYALLNAGLLIEQAPQFNSLDEKFLLINSWLNVHRAGKKLRYNRINGIDTVNEKAVAISHLNKDFVNFLGVYLYICEINSFDGFGRIPRLEYNIRDDEAASFDLGGIISHKKKYGLKASLISLHDYRRWNSNKALPFNLDPFSRRNIIERFYVSSDFSSVFCDAKWWKPGVWYNPAYDK